ncbi:MAG: hypothetical protein KDA77_15510, partial [Planctomycetaceae bacterium]|nr:hypothetical protein [Planctomycetaceae bacterium]
MSASAFAWLEDAPPASVKLRVEWGEQTPRLWNARFDLTGGQFSHVNSLGVDADEAAAISMVDQKIVYQPRTSRVFNSIEFQVRGNLSTKLQVFLQDRNDPHVTVQHQFLLQDLLKQKSIMPIRQTGAQLVVQQAPGDAFALEIDHPHLVFEPDEMIQAQAFPKYLLTSEEPVSAELQWFLYRARTRELVASGSKPVVQQDRHELLQAGIPLAVKAPLEGVYDLVVQMGAEHRAVAQFIVISRQAKPLFQSASRYADQVLVDEFEPGGVQDHHAIVPRRPRQRIRNSFKSLFKGAPQAGSPEQHAFPWSAYHLKLTHRSRPHRLVVSYSGGAQAHAGFSILEPDASGQLVPVGVDSGVYQAATGLASVSEEPPVESQSEVIFWPKIDNPILLFHGLGTDIPAEVTRVQVYELPAPDLDLAAIAEPGSENKRLVGPYLQKPLL